MNDLMKPSELNQFLLQHSIVSSINSGGIKSSPKDDDSVFGGVWVQPEEETKKNSLSLTGTEIWGPKPQHPSERSVSGGISIGSSVKSTPSDVTPEPMPERKDKFSFGGWTAGQTFSSGLSAYSQFPNGMTSFGLISPSADIPLNQNSSNNTQRKSDLLMSADESKFKTLGSIWNDASKPATNSTLTSANQQDILENLAYAMCDWGQKSTIGSSAVMSKLPDASSLPDFRPSSFGLQKELERNDSNPSYGSGGSNLPLQWSSIVKQSILQSPDEAWLKLKNSVDPMIASGSSHFNNKLTQSNQPQCFLPWDQSSRPFSQNSNDAWNIGGGLKNQQQSNLHMLANQQQNSKLLSSLNSTGALKDMPYSVKFDPSIPPPPLPVQGPPMPASELQILAASTSLPAEQLLSLMGKSSANAAAIAPYLLNLTKASNLASSLKSSQMVPPPVVGSSNSAVSGFTMQNAATNPNYPWASSQRISNIKLAVLYRKFARHLFLCQQIPQTRSKMLQQLISLGFKREDAGKALMDNDLDFELALGELIFKTAIEKGLIDNPNKVGSPGQFSDSGLLKGSSSSLLGKPEENLQNYLSSLELIIEKQRHQHQQQVMNQGQGHFSSSSIQQPQIDYSIQALLNGQPSPSPSTYLPNLSFTNNSHSNNNTGIPHYNNNNSHFQSSVFDSVGSLTPSPPFLANQHSSASSSLNPQCPEWVPSACAAIQNGGLSSSTVPDHRSSGNNDASLEVAAILNNLKLSNHSSCSEASPTIGSSGQLPWSSGKMFSNAVTADTSETPLKVSNFSLSSSSGLSSIKEFIPGVPWTKDCGPQLSMASDASGGDSVSRQSYGGVFGSYFSDDGNSVSLGNERHGNEYKEMDSSCFWVSGGSDGRSAVRESDESECAGSWLMGEKFGGFYDHNYKLDSTDDGGAEERGLNFDSDCGVGTKSYDTGVEEERQESEFSLFQSNWIVIKNIPEDISEETMTDLLVKYGQIKSMTFMKETCSVLVCYSNKLDAVEAKNGFEYPGSYKMSVEFVPDWTMSINTGGTKVHDFEDGSSFFDGKDYEDEATAARNGMSLTEMGYTTPGGLWIPSKVLQNLEFCSNTEGGDDVDDDEAIVGGNDDDGDE